jgi:hypothetical protein
MIFILPRSYVLVNGKHLFFLHLCYSRVGRLSGHLSFKVSPDSYEVNLISGLGWKIPGKIIISLKLDNLLNIGMIVIFLDIAE